MGSLPNLTPIFPTLALALELSAGSTHSSAAIGTHAIQNAGYHICTRPVGGQLYKLHTHLANSSLDIVWSQGKSQTAECISSSTARLESLVSRSLRRWLALSALRKEEATLEG